MLEAMIKAAAQLRQRPENQSDEYLRAQSELIAALWGFDRSTAVATRIAEHVSENDTR